MKVTNRLALAVILIAFLACSCGEETRPINLIIIGLDTVRADHLGCYGYHRQTSPSIDRLASEGALFEYAISHSPWTLPSFATVFTSLYPTQHGAGFMQTTMGRSFPTLASILTANGYSTGAIINTAALSTAFGIERGFTHYEVVPATAGRVADGTTHDALAWIDNQADTPFFIFVHYYDPHLSFSPPAPYDTLFDPGYTGEIGNAFDPDFLMVDRKSGFPRMNALSESDRRHIEALYDGEIAFADRAIGDLIDGLQTRGLRDRTLIVFLSDHGEEFFDHGGFAHGHTLYEELLRVPLIFSLRDCIPAGVRVPGMVRLVDIMPTVLSLLGIDNDARMEGRNLEGLFGAGAETLPSARDALLSREAFAEGMLFGPEQKSITSFPYKLIRHMPTGDEMLFNLDDDPAESLDLTADGDGGEAPGRKTDEHIALQQLLYGTLFRASDTWYIQIDPAGPGHMLDITITAGREPAPVEITLYKAFDAAGNLLRDGEVGLCRESKSSIRLAGLSLDDKFMLAFKAEPPGVPVEFNIIVDGEPANARTYVGESAEPPAEMPFTRRGGGGRKALGKPPSHPDPPYFLVWHSGEGYEDRRPLKMGRDTQRELRSIGYIQ